MYKIKLLSTFCLLLTLFNAMGQNKTYQFKYIDRNGENAGVLTANYKAFRFDDDLISTIKTGTTGMVYNFAGAGDGKYVAIRITKEQYLPQLLNYVIDPAKIDTIIKKDTIYYKSDSVIAGFKCRKIGVNYIVGVVADERSNKTNNRDTVKTWLWVSSISQQNGLFNFASKDINGLILRYQLVKKNPYSEKNVYIHYTAVATGKKVIPASVFEIPKPYELYTDQQKFDKHVMAVMAKNMKTMLKGTGIKF